MPRMLQGLAPQLMVPVGNTVVGPELYPAFQFKFALVKFTVPTAIDPVPGPPPGPTPSAPVGIVLIPSELFKARNDSQLTVS